MTKKYIQIVGPFYIFQGIGLSLYFASQGANAMKWPTIATIARFIIACAGGGISVYWLDLGIESIFISSSAAMAIFGLMIFISIKKVLGGRIFSFFQIFFTRPDFNIALSEG